MMATVKEYAKEFMEFRERFNSIGFDLVGSRTNSGVKFYTVKERKKELIKPYR